MAESNQAVARSAPSTDRPSPSVMTTYARQNIVFDRGEGSWLLTAEGDRYLDFTSGIAVNSLGHANPHLIEALTAQAGKLWHTSNLFRVGEQERLAERLCEATFADKIFFCNSGTEACEGAIKTVRRYHYSCGEPDRWRIITFEGAFHGRTMAALSAAGNAKYLEGFGEPVSGFDHVPLGDIEAVKAAISDQTAAIMIEPIQGEGGVRVVSNEFLKELRDLCDENGLLLVFDEVQTGVGRTGKLFAYQHTGIEPDIMTIAKGIGGGFPLGAILATEKAASGMQPGTHGSTFGGNPMACAVGNAVLDVILEPGFLEAVEQKSARARQYLAEIEDDYSDLVEEVRISGLLIGLKLRPSAQPAELVSAALAEKLLAVGAGDNVVRLLPPLTISDEEISEGFARLKSALSSLRNNRS